MKITRAVITAAARDDRHLPLQQLVDRASLAEPRRRIRIGLPLAKREGRIPGESGRRHAFAASTDEAEGTAGA